MDPRDDGRASEGIGALPLQLAAQTGLAALAARHAGFLPRGTEVSVPAPPKPAPNPAFIRPWQ